MYEPLDEDTRRQRREEATSPYNTNQSDGGSWWERSGLDPDGDGMGSPESGYGPGGVENPAYNGPGAPDRTPEQPRTIQGQTMVDRWTPPAPAQPTTSGGGNPAPMFQPPAPAAPAPPSMQTPGITNDVTRILQGRLKELSNPGDVDNDPIYQQSVRAYQIGQLRSAEQQRKALAERSAASGTRSSGGFNVNVRGIQERAGENAAQYRSGLAMDRLKSRESQLVEYIKMARAVGQDDLANQLELQRLSLQQELGRGDLALRGSLGYGNLGLGYADLIQRANRDAVLAALGGNG